MKKKRGSRKSYELFGKEVGGTPTLLKDTGGPPMPLLWRSRCFFLPNNESRITNNSSLSAFLGDLCGLAVNYFFMRQRCGAASPYL